MIDPKITTPGQTRGKGIEGGTSHVLSKGEVIPISPKTLHWWKDTSKTGLVGYDAVNVEADQLLNFHRKDAKAQRKREVRQIN